MSPKLLAALLVFVVVVVAVNALLVQNPSRAQVKSNLKVVAGGRG